MAYGAAILQGHGGAPELPPEVAHVWAMFCDLSAARGHMVPISYQEIEAYGRLTHNPPTPWEIEQIKALDAIALGIWAKGPSKRRTSANGADARSIDRVLDRVGRRG